MTIFHKHQHIEIPILVTLSTICETFQGKPTISLLSLPNHQFEDDLQGRRQI